MHNDQAMTHDNPRLGLQRGTVRIVEADPTWPDAFRAEVQRLSAAVSAAGLPALAFEHVGSTAVPGLVAKPIIDLMAGHEHDVEPYSYFDALREVGYEHRGPQKVPEPVALFVLGPESRRTHHLNLARAGGAFWRDHLIFRDRLRNEPELRAAYAELKHRLAAAHAMDRRQYTAGKATFVESALRDQPPMAIP
jgi:GrpB-like predicted nucleotidyltransferase (UPF0157 family)